MTIAVPVAYIVLSHAHPALVRRLAHRLLDDDPQCHVICEHQAGGPPLELEASERLHVRESPRPGGWGGFGLVDAVLGALRFARETLDPGWVVLLSGQDYPAVSAAEIRRRLETSGHDALLDLWRVIDDSDPSAEARWWRVRYFMRWYAPPGLPRSMNPRRQGVQRRLSFAQPFVFVWTLPRGAGTRVGFKRRRTPFGPGFPCRAGSQWFALGRRAQVSVLDQLRARPELVDFYRRTIIPDESFFNTLVANDPALAISGENLTFFRPDGPGNSHAGVLDEDDLEAIAASGRPLVRKVELERSAALMDALDARAARG